MNNKWLILLMTPLCTYASYENDGWEDREILSHADFYVEAVQDDFMEMLLNNYPS